MIAVIYLRCTNRFQGYCKSYLWHNYWFIILEQKPLNLLYVIQKAGVVISLFFLPKNGPYNKLSQQLVLDFLLWHYYDYFLLWCNKVILIILRPFIMKLKFENKTKSKTSKGRSFLKRKEVIIFPLFPLSSCLNSCKWSKVPFCFSFTFRWKL